MNQIASQVLTAAATPPAGGAEITEVIIATAMVSAVFSVLVLAALAQRAGRLSWIDRAAQFAGRLTYLPPWVALPSTLIVVSLLAAVFGLYWDISLHVSDGRDPGPLANPSHYLILIGLLGVFAAGVLAITLPPRGSRPSEQSVRLASDWYAPVGGILIAASAAFGLAGFPLDDVWHRLFGQDVTLWGPTHMLMLMGAGLTLVGQCVLLVEGSRSMERAGKAAPPRTVRLRGLRMLALKSRRAFAAGGLLVALSIFQGEFDFGIPQFQLALHPVLIMSAAGVALVMGRVWAGRGGALAAVGLYLVVRTLLLLFVDPLMDRPTPHFPLYLAEALVVEAVAFAVPVRRLMRFAVAAGVAIGSVGLAAEWAWTHVWMPYPWTSALLPEAILLGLPSAVAGATIGAWIAHSLAGRPALAGPARFAAPAGVAALAVILAIGLADRGPDPVTATVTTAETRSPSSSQGRWIEFVIEMPDTRFDRDVKWAQVLAWQGPGFRRYELVRTAPGTYSTREPVPAYGSWKTVARFHNGRTLAALPIFQPRDDAIPAPEIPALPRFERALTADAEVLQRESKIEGGLLPAIGYISMLAVALTLLALLAWGIRRMGGSVVSDDSSDESGARGALRPGRPVRV